MTSASNWGNAQDRAIAGPQPFAEQPEPLLTDEDLGRLQSTTVQYYLHESNPDNGLVRDKTHPRTPASIAAMGLALTTLPVFVERGVIVREYVAKIARKRLRYLTTARRAGSRRLGIQGFLLSLPGHGHGPPGLAVRVVHHRFSISVRRRTGRRHLFRRRQRG